MLCSDNSQLFDLSNWGKYPCKSKWSFVQLSFMRQFSEPSWMRLNHLYTYIRNTQLSSSVWQRKNEWKSQALAIKYFHPGVIYVIFTHIFLAKVLYKHVNLREQGSIIFFRVHHREEPEAISATILSLKSYLIYILRIYFNK